VSETKRYKNPPLIQVASSIWWHVEESRNFEKSKFISGILYPKLKEHYEEFEVLAGSNNPFTSLILLNKDKQYVLEIAPNELKLSSVDENYCWNEFFAHVHFMNSLVVENLVNLLELDHVHARLEYVDFFKYNYSAADNNLSSYLSANLNVNINSNILNNPSSISLSLKQKISDEITSSIDLKIGKSDSEEGIIVHLKNDSNKMDVHIETLDNWFNKSHDLSKQQFEGIIKGPLKKSLEYVK